MARIQIVFKHQSMWKKKLNCTKALVYWPHFKPWSCLLYVVHFTSLTSGLHHGWNQMALDHLPLIISSVRSTVYHFYIISIFFFWHHYCFHVMKVLNNITNAALIYLFVCQRCTSQLIGTIKTEPPFNSLTLHSLLWCSQWHISVFIWLITA